MSQNIDSAAIGTAKIADSAVTSAKVDWATLNKSIGTNSSYVKFGNLLIQWGQLTGLRSDTNTTYTIPQSFANT